MPSDSSHMNNTLMEEVKTMSLRGDDDNNKKKKKSKQNKQNEEEENIENSKWANIPDDMLEEVMKRLTLKDYIGLCTICSTWRAIVANAIAKKHCHPLPEFPLILLKSKDSRFFSLSTEREHLVKKPLLVSTQTCHGTIEGWLIVGEFSEGRSNGLSIFFLNPVTNDRIIIPSKLKFPHKSPNGLYIRKMKASSKPNSYGTSDCYLVGILSDYCHIAIYKLFNKSWIMIEADKDSGIYFMDVEVIGTILYVKSDISLYSILVYDLKDCTEDGPKIKPKVIAKLPEIRPIPTSTIIDNHRSDINHPICGFAKDEFGQLYCIAMICNAEYKTENVGYLNIVKEYVKAPQIASVQVYKFDMMSEKKPSEWWKRVSLEDHVVFYSGVNTMVLSKGALNWNEELFRGNSLYFAFCYPCPKDPWSGFQLGMFCMTDNSTKDFHLDTSNHLKVPYPFWFIPSI